MTKIIEIEIERCFYCDYHTAGCLCTKTGKEIEDCDNVIPSWCPLPDKPKSEGHLNET